MAQIEIEGKLPLVLVAEDDESNFKLIKAVIGKKVELVWARTGVEIIDNYRALKGQARKILMDLKMPVMDGIKATKTIREEDKEIPIIAQTAYAFECDRERALGAGCNGIMVKPITLQTMRSTITQYIPEVVW